MIDMENVKELKKHIYSHLARCSNKKCIYLDLPYYTNIGDVLIWQGTESFIKENNIECIYRTDYSNFNYKDIEADTIIFLQGGGNFGDIWRQHQDFRLRIIELYPNNPIIILPQTIYYEDDKKLEQDAALMNKHNNLTICARDTVSLEILTKYFTNSKNLLVPDMAYCIDDKILDRYKSKEVSDKALYLKRTDKEYKENPKVEELLAKEQRPIDKRDWPSMEKKSLVLFIYGKLMAVKRRIDNRAISHIIDIYMCKIFRPAMLKIGIEFVSKYPTIYTTRLHVAILSTLLEKDFTFVDNSYGKNKQFYQTWLSENKNITFISE